jgi:all-trans-retinol 13,14-reductase
MEFMFSKDKKITIIGSGLGGLLCGYLLSKEGFQVTVLEKHRKPGGCLQTFKRDMYSFDTGMHYIGGMDSGQPLNRYWNYFGLSQKLDLLQMEENGFDVIHYYGTDFPLAQGFENFREKLLPLFPEQGTALEKYTNLLKEVVDAHPLYNLELPSGNVPSRFLRMNASRYLADLSPDVAYASCTRLGNILAGNNFLYAGDPASTSLDQLGLINHSYISSAWRIAGGSKQMTDILVEGIEEHGGKVLLKKKVVSIEKPKDQFVIQTADGDQFAGDQVIANTHPQSALKMMSGISFPKATIQRINDLSNTVSVFTVYLGLKTNVFPFMNHNVYHYSSDAIWSGNPPVEDQWPNSYLLMTPPESDQGQFAKTAVIMSTMRTDELDQWKESASGVRDKSYFVFKAKRSKKLLDLVYQRFPELQEALATIDISTPLTWRDYTGTPEGSMYGIQKEAANPEKTMILPKTKIPGFFLTGQNVNLHGALGVTIGAVMTCGEILGLEHVLQQIKGSE